MKARVIATRYPQLEGDDPATSIRHRRSFGEIIEVSKEEFERGVQIGALQAESDTAPGVDETNLLFAQEAGIATQPSGEPITDEEGNPVETPAGADLNFEEWTAPRTHKAANAELKDHGIVPPEGATVRQKVAMLEQYRAAAQSGDAPQVVATEDISELSDGELIQRAVDFGLGEEEVIEKSHDELVLIVAEAMHRQSADPAEQRRLADGELARQREANTASNNQPAK